MNSTETTFRTTDLHLASYLLATDHALVGISGPPGQREFSFRDVPHEDVQAFYAGAPSDARKVLGALRDLRGLLAQEARR